MTFLQSGMSALGRSFAIDMTQFWIQGVKVILSLLILTILTALAGGTLMTFVGLQSLFTEPLEIVMRQVIVNTLLLLAIVEVLKTTLTYFSEGRVKVTFIVDTILVVMLTEVISQWFKEAHMMQWAILGGIIVTLALTRVVAVQWSPTKNDERPDSSIAT